MMSRPAVVTTTGARQVTVALTAADQIDTRLVQVLGIARARLRESDAELVVTAADLPMRSELWGTGKQTDAHHGRF